MSDFGIGISGIFAAHNAMTTIGNNIANVATDGYHRQRVNLRPNDPEDSNGISIGQGVTTLEPKRMIDRFLENALIKQGAANEQYTRELSVLKSIENILGDLSGTGLSKTVTDFYNKLRGLSSAPQGSGQEDALTNQAAVLTSQLNTIGTFLENVENQIQLEAENMVGEINSLSASVAEMNYRLQELEVRGAEGSNLRDQRDQIITDISKLIGVTTQPEGDGAIVNVYVGGFPIVMGTTSTEISVSPVSDNELGVSPADVRHYNPDIRGGKLGGLIAVKNEYIGSLKSELDTLAVDIITSFNKLHVQGVPSYNIDTGIGGSFKTLDGWTMSSEELSESQPPISDGTIQVRVTDTLTGVIKRYSIDVVAATDTLSSMAAKFDAIDGLSSSVNSLTLHMEADANYKFDFIPSPLPVPAPTISSPLAAGTSVASVGGIYTGSDGNQEYTMTIKELVGPAEVGVDTFDVEVWDGAAVPNLVGTITVPATYTPGDLLTTFDGLEISFSGGAGETVVDGDTFTVTALSSPKVSGFYTGETDEVYTCTVVEAAPPPAGEKNQVGVTDNLLLQITNSAGDPVRSVNIGSGYVPGTRFFLDEKQGIELQMEIGDLVNGQSFEVKGFADTDTSDFLAVTGINSFFKGHGASTIAVNEKFRDGDAMVSVSIGVDMSDNGNIKRISQLSDKPMEDLGYLTQEAYYRKVATGLAQKIRVTTLSQENSESVMIELRSQRDKLSGVDINNEAAELMVYEQMFQSMAKYMTMIKENMQAVMNIL